MLRWRLPLGALIIAALAGACWLDVWLEEVTAIPGIALFPVSVAFVVLAGREMLDLAEAVGLHALPWVVYAGSLVVVGSGWASVVCLHFAGGLPSGAEDLGLSIAAAASEATVLALAAAVLGAFVAQMCRYGGPGGATANVAADVFAVVYVGFLLSFLVLLRLTWGVGALASVLIVVKMGDTGAYAVGRLIGRRQMAPGLSPSKTVEGAIGAVVFACVASWATFRWLVPVTTPERIETGPWWGWIVFGLLMAAAGMAGDLAESLIKRDARRKDSGHRIPGLGGVLDMLDSLLLAAPVAYGYWWVFGAAAR